MSLKPLQSRLAEAFGPEEGRATLRLLVEDLLGRPWSRLAAGLEELDPAGEEKLTSAITRIIQGEPPQYITGRAWFFGRPFAVGPGVLIPRPETEELVAWAKSTIGKQPARCLDVGTGSGCIAVSLALECPNTRVEALDLSHPALIWAAENAKALKASVQFHRLDFLQAAGEDFQGLDVLISNPPYVPASEQAAMQARVRDHEPGLALFVPDDNPLPFYEKLAAVAPQWLKPGGYVFCEIHEDYGQEVLDLFAQTGLAELTLKKDLQGKDRMVSGKLG